MNRLDRIKCFFGLHVHERRVFCVTGIAFMKCVTCGAESIPWFAPQEAADEWEKANPDAVTRLVEIEKKIEGARA